MSDKKVVTVRSAIALGVAKFNVGTVLKQAFLKGLQEALAALPDKVDLQQVIGSRLSHFHR